MIFEGEEHFAYEVATVWNALHDVDVLRRALPGCKSLTIVSKGVYEAALSLGVAAVKGEYTGTVKVTDVKPFGHYKIEGTGKGAPGFVQLNMDCYFEAEQAGSLMRWKCDAAVGGVIAGVGGKVLSGISKFMAQQFFRAVKNELAKDGHSSPGATSAALPGPAPGPSAPRTHRGWLSRLWALITRRTT